LDSSPLPLTETTPTSDKITKKKFGWAPVEMGLLDDIEANTAKAREAFTT